MQVLLTFDVENKYGSETDLITADNIQYKPGTRWIMDKLEEHGHKGVFFVNIYEHMAYDRNYISDLVQEIDSRGHEAALHMHHESYFNDPYLKEYDNLTKQNKTELIEYGVQFFQDAIGKSPSSYRAGAFIIDDETFDVLDESGLKVDSSLCFGYNLPGNSWISNKNRIPEYQHIQLPYKIRPHLWEFPITTIARGNTYRNFSIDHFHEKSIESALEQMYENNMPFAVLLGHSFSFLSFGKTKMDVLGPNLHAMKSFQNLLQYLRLKVGVSGATFEEILKGGARVPTGSQSFVPQVEKNWVGKKNWNKLNPLSGLLKKSNLNPNAGKTVWLHIGTWKTGTTSIQKFLRLNEKWLKKCGYFLPVEPALLNDPGAKWLCNHRPIVLKNLNVLKTLKKSVLDSNDNNIVLTSENIVYADLESIRHLRVALAGCTVKVVVYLRRQDQYSQSLYGQHIKGGVKTSLSFEQHFMRHKEKYQYEKILEGFSNIFGPDNIVVRPYEKGQWHNHDLIEDFCATIGLPPLNQAMKEKVTSTNFSFSLPTLRFIRESNKTEIKNRPLMIKYLGMFNNERENISLFHHHNWISGQRQQQVIDEFSDGNSFIATKYLGRDDGCLFYDPPPDVEELAGPDSITAEEAMEISLYLWEKSQTDE